MGTKGHSEARSKAGRPSQCNHRDTTDAKVTWSARCSEDEIKDTRTDYFKLIGW